MKASKQKKLQAAGWKVGSAAEFLELTDAEAMLVNMKLALATHLKTLRQQSKVTQLELAKRIGSSQSRVAKMEIADKSVSLELLVRALATPWRNNLRDWQNHRDARCCEEGTASQELTLTDPQSSLAKISSG